jgi:hypothetical protein
MEYISFRMKKGLQGCYIVYLQLLFCFPIERRLFFISAWPHYYYVTKYIIILEKVRARPESLALQ